MHALNQNGHPDVGGVLQGAVFLQRATHHLADDGRCARLAPLVQSRDHAVLQKRHREHAVGVIGLAQHAQHVGDGLVVVVCHDHGMHRSIEGLAFGARERPVHLFGGNRPHGAAAAGFHRATHLADALVERPQRARRLGLVHAARALRTRHRIVEAHLGHFLDRVAARQHDGVRVAVFVDVDFPQIGDGRLDALAQPGFGIDAGEQHEEAIGAVARHEALLRQAHGKLLAQKDLLRSGVFGTEHRTQIGRHRYADDRHRRQGLLGRVGVLDGRRDALERFFRIQSCCRVWLRESRGERHLHMAPFDVGNVDEGDHVMAERILHDVGHKACPADPARVFAPELLGQLERPF